MKTFKGFISELSEEFVQLYHGTHKDHIASFKKDGLRMNSSRANEKRGNVFLSPKPDVAFAYAVMGGELNYLTKAKDIPDEDRALVVFKIPKDWYDKHKVRAHGGRAPEVSFDIGIPSKFVSKVVVGDRKKVYALPDTKLEYDY